MYESTKWQDRVVDAESGEVIQEGTNLSAANFNNMEGGITDAYMAMALLQTMVSLMVKQIEIIEYTANVQEQNRIGYPAGFTRDNSVVLSVMLSDDKKNYYYDVGNDVEITLCDDSISVVSISENDKYIKIVLCKYK